MTEQPDIPYVVGPATEKPIGNGLIIKIDLPPIQGIGILRFPNEEYPSGSARQIACELAQHIGSGTILAMPSTRHPNGDYKWDFHIEGGPADQVTVKRSPSLTLLWPCPRCGVQTTHTRIDERPTTRIKCNECELEHGL